MKISGGATVKFPAWMLASLAILMAALAGPSVAAERTVSTPEGYVRHLASLINDYRERNGLGQLAFAGELTALAGEHSESMSAQRRLSHEGFRARAQRAASKVCVENVARGFPSAETLLEGWRHSPAHHDNLLDPAVSRMGIAATARYVTFFACR